MKKPFMCMLLVLCMVFTLFPSAAFAEETGSVTIGNTAIDTSSVTESAPLCESHKAHDKDCGYIETKDAQPCGHLNEGGEYSCAPVKDSGKATDEYNCDHSDGCGYIEAKDGADCTHECELCLADDADKDVAPASLSATPRVSTVGYSYNPGTTTLTIFSNEGTTRWSDYGTGIAKANVTTVVIESGVTSIGSNAFNGCANLASVTFADGDQLKTIGNAAFKGCTSLASVTIPSGVTSINLEAFRGCTELDSVTIPEGVTTISNSAFYGCASLASVTIPSGVTAIGDAAFSGCGKLASVTFAEGSQLTTIGNSAFEWCTSLASVTIPSGVTTIGKKAFYYCPELASVTFAPGSQLKTIAQGAFYDCTKLANVTIPEGVTTIGDAAFVNCTSLENVTIPSNVTTIESNVFSGCSILTSVTFEGATPPTTFGTNVFTNTANGLKIYVPKDKVDEYKAVSNLLSYASSIVAKSDPITGVGYSYDPDTKTLTIDSDAATTAWRNDNSFDTIQSNVTTVDIKSGVDSIGDKAFYECVNLTSVTILSGVTAIGANAFGRCTSLASVTIPGSVTTFGIYAFFNCTNLTSVTILSGVTSIGEAIFSGCTSLTSVTIPSSVTAIRNAAFHGCTSLASVTIPGSVTTIGGSAFEDCASLASVTIPEGVITIGKYAFAECTNLASVTFEGATPPTTFETNVFTDTADTLKIYVPTADAVTDYKAKDYLATWKNRIVVVGSNAIIGEGYSYDPDSKALTIFSDIGTIKWDDAITGITRTDVTTVVIESGVTDISYYTFDGCTNLESVTIPNSVTIISQNAFYGCTNLASVIIPESVTTIGESAFRNCTSLESVTIPSNVNKIRRSAFQGCTNLASVTFEGATPPTEIEEGVFTRTANTLKIYVPKGSVQTYKNVANLATWENNIVAKSDPIMGEGFSYDTDTKTLTIFSNEGTTAWSALGTNISLPDVTKVDIQSGVTKIGDNAFNLCNNLANVTIPSSVTSIGDKAFGGCTSLASITIPSSVTSIGDNAFSQCVILTRVTFEGATPPLFGTEVFTSTPDTLKIYVPTADAVEAYKAVPNLYTWKNSIARTGKKWDVRDISVGTTLLPGDLLDLSICPRFISINFMDGLSNYGQVWSAFVGGGFTPLYTYEKALEDNVTTPIPEGTRFICWKVTKMEGACTESSCPLVGTEHGATVIDLEAVYEPISAGSHTVTLNANGGSVSPTSLTVTAGNTATLPTPSRSGSYRFDGWFTASSGGTQYTNSTPIDRNVTLYAHWTYTGGGSTGGGSSNIAVTPPAPDKPNTPTQAEIKVDGKTDANGNTTITVTDKNITDAIAKAEADAKKNDVMANGVTIVLSATGGKNATNVTVNLPKTVQDTIISKKVVSTIIVVDNPDVQIGMDLKAVTEINAQAKSDVNITAQRLDSGKLTGTAQTAIGSRPVFNLAVNIVSATGNSSGKQVQSFGAGSVSVTIPYTLGANEKAGNVCAVYVDNNGKVQWLTNSVYDRTAKVLRFSTSHFSTYGVGYKQDAPAFTDIANHWAKSDIEYAVSRGLFAGTDATTFSPNTAMTRGMFVTALGRLANADVSSYKTSSFNDVKADSYYMGYIEWANKNNIVNGSDGKFMPDQSITREQVAVIMQNYAKVIGFTLPRVHEEKAFADSAKISGYAKEAVKAMQMAGVLSCKSGNVFDPQGTATRAEVSAVLRHFVELRISIDTAQGWTMNDSGKWMYYENGKPVTGKKDIGGASYTFNQNGETADVPKNLTYGTYTVKKGDSWWKIAWEQKYNIFELVRINNKTIFSIIYTGDVLKVPQQ